MRRYYQAILLFLTAGLFLASCGTGAEEPVPSAAVPTVASSSTSEPPTVMAVTSTQTYTPEPLPTEPQPPAIPPGLAVINYRTLGQIEEIAQISLVDVVGLEFSPNHRYLRMRQQQADETYADTFLDLEIGEDIFSLEGEQRTYFNLDSSTIAVLDNSSLSNINLATLESKKVWESRFLPAALSPDGRKLVELELADGQDPGTTIHVTDLTTEEELYQIYVNSLVEKEALHFDGDGELLAASYFVPPGTHVSRVWNAERGYPLYTTYGFDEIALHPFGSEVALSNAKEDYISLVSTVTWQQKLYLGPAGGGPGYYDIAYAAGGSLIYALHDEDKTYPTFWFPPSGERLAFDHDLDLLALTISPDKKLLATSDKEGYVRIWGVTD